MRLRFGFVLLCAALAGCGTSSPDAKSPTTEADPTAGWPKDAPGLVTHLNSWNSKDLEAYERPDLDLQAHLCAAAGETGEWVEAHKVKLTKLGVSILWNNEKCIYERAP